jgi:RHS repeat-associated protein
VLGQLDPTLFLNGIAYLRVSATDTFGATTTSEPRTVVLTKNQKLGQFTVSFKDLEVPLSGLAIQLLRTYDSRTTAVGDFGIGWALDVRNVKLRDNGKVSLDWYGSVVGSGLSTRYCVQGTRAHVLTATLSDGTVYRFEPQLNTGLGFFSPAVPNCQPLAPIQSAQLAFRQVSGPPATLHHIGAPGVVIQSAWPGPVELLDENTLEPVDFSRYTLTLPDGRTLTLNRGTGLEQLVDTNSNTLTVTPAGIFHSSGKSIAFQRDAQQRITRVTDPAGNTLFYAYDGDGNLTSVTDQVGMVTTYGYDANHRLISIRDPRGIEPVRNEYDASGRLIRHIDGAGNTVGYVHDIAGRREIITDRLGNVTTNEYDSDGNVTRVIDALGGETFRTYDGLGNVLTETDQNAHTRSFTYDANNNRLTESDALGNTTRFTYAALNRLETITDPLGRVIVNGYDGAGNLTSTRDAAGSLTRYTYDARGNRTSTIDPLGGVTTYEPDGNGNVTRQVNALGHVTTYTYDLNGNRRTETGTQTTPLGARPVTTTFEYDGQNRLTRTIYPDGGTTRITYNEIGKQATTVDQLGRETKYEYDAMGRLTRTLYADGTNESVTYDEEGNRITSTNRGGRTTKYTYDALKRLTRTTHADAAFEQTEYDAVGQMARTIDARGNPTQFGYDVAGRRERVIDALGHVTQLSYDSAGNQRLLLDANGHLTQHGYDVLNRRIRTTYQDGTFDETVFDAIGRAQSKRDQAGIVTQYRYDLLGRLTRVIDALSQETSYTYDELGSRLTQTDTNGHTTRFEYDVMGRRTKRTLPLGMSEVMTYDVAGTLKTKTDFNGKTTTYAYEQNNRLTSKVPDSTLSEPTIRFTYALTGQRAQMVDGSGITNYTYDERDRLKLKETPQGTLSYTYDLAGNLATMRSSNAGGTSIDYAYDALNRLATVTDNRLGSGVTTYAYDDVGNLASYRYPNGVAHIFAYNPLNRLEDLTVANATTTLASYAYTLGPVGNRQSVAELAGRRVEYSYDVLYRLKSEAISGAPGGTTTYIYDPVGNRRARSSPTTGLTNYDYDANDRLLSNSYDSNGNTTGSGATKYAHDFEDHLTAQNEGVLRFVYDGDGNRVVRMLGGLSTRYLVDDRNPTGYAQVLEELEGGAAAQKLYAYGLGRISLTQPSGTSYYVYDGRGSVRALTDASGAATDSYTYDGFGSTLETHGATPNTYLFSGEQNDAGLGLYYLRARYLDPSSGRFMTADPFGGYIRDPISLHRYLYASADPIDRTDPSGRFTLTEVSATLAIQGSLVPAAIGQAAFGAVRIGAVQIAARALRPQIQIQQAALLQIDSGQNEDQAIQQYSRAQRAIAFVFGMLHQGLGAVKQAQDWTDYVTDIGGLAQAFVSISPRTLRTAAELSEALAVTQRSLARSRDLPGYADAVKASVRATRSVLNEVVIVEWGLLDFEAELANSLVQEVDERLKITDRIIESLSNAP